MYTIIVADDEEEIRRALIDKTDWEQAGFEVIGEAENGVEALDLVEKLNPDVLLTDIKMPFVSGIELARQVREVHPSTQIVFLSGYDDFSYAQQAIQYNIISYLLKPISASELLLELKKIKEKIDEQFRMFKTGGETSGREGTASFFIPLLLDEFQNENDETRNKELYKKLSGTGLVSGEGGSLLYTVMTVTILSDAEINMTTEENVNAVALVLDKYFKSVSFYINGKIASVLISTKRGFDKYLHIAVEEIAEKVRRIMGYDASIGIGRLENGLSCIHKAYVDSIKAVGYASNKKRGIFFISDMEQYRNSADLISESAVEIINRSYMDPDISLVSVSNEIVVSPNYLSAIIKKATGRTFVDLLSKKRIAVAKDLLLHSNYRIGEIAEKCGYNDQHYFSYSFKKITGLSPNALRRGEIEVKPSDE